MRGTFQKEALITTYFRIGTNKPILIQGKAREDGEGSGRGVRRASRQAVCEGGLGLRSGDRERSYVSALPGKPPRPDTHEECVERLFKEVKRRTKVVGVFPSETNASTLATEIVLRSSEEWALKCYLTMDALKAIEKPNPQHSS